MSKYSHLTKDEKMELAKKLEKEIEAHYQKHSYYKNRELALKTVLNQSYGAISNRHYIMFNNNVAGSITYVGRELIQKMELYNRMYWYKKWHTDTHLHAKLYIKNVTQITDDKAVSIYCDTDSIDGKSMVNIQLDSGDVKNITIEEWYNNNMVNGSGGETLVGHESVITTDKILNFDDVKLTHHNVSRIIRHKVKKEKWLIKTKSGNEILVTNDHSMIVYRDGDKIEIKPCDIKKTDKILIVLNQKDLEFTFDEIEICEKVGYFDDEYVYDVEVDDDTHTFIANEMLVHNSLFLSYDGAITNSDWKNQVFQKDFIEKIDVNFMILLKNDAKLDFTFNNQCFKGYIYGDELLDENIEATKQKLISNNIYSFVIDGFYIKNNNLKSFLDNNKSVNLIPNFSVELDYIHGIDLYRIEKYFKQCLEKHAALYGVANVQDFELEKIADSVINIEKKRYIMNLAWEDGVYFEALKNIQTKGFDIVRSSTPLFARGGKDKKDGVMKVINYLFTHPDTFNMKELLKIVKELRREMEILPIDDICAQSSCSNYKQKVLNDKTGVDVVSMTHFAVKAAAYHNYLLYNNSEFETKYSYITSGEKVKYYYCKGDMGLNVFAYKRGSFPIEIAPPIDYDESFYRFVLSPVNSLVTTLNLPKISERLTVVLDLFSGI